MANTKISALTALTGANVASDDALPIVDTSVTTTKKIDASELKTYMSNSPTLVTPNIGVATGTSLDVSGVLESGANAGTGGQLKMFGSTSGDATLKVAAAAGTATIFQLPATNGTNTYALTTNGSGVTSWNQIGLTTAVTGTLPIANGGTGTTSAQGAMNAFAGAVTSGSYLRGNGSNVVMSAIQTADVPTLNQNTTGTAAGLSSTLVVGSGGTGTATAFTAGSVVFAGTSGTYSQDNANFFWDDSNNRLGIGTATPQSTFVVSDGGASGVEFFTNAPGGGAGTYFQSYNRSGGAYVTTAYYASAHTFRTNAGATSLVIDTSGNLNCSGVYSAVVGGTNRDVYVDNTGLIGYVSSLRDSKINISNLTNISWLYDLNVVSFNYRKKDEEGSYTNEIDGDIQYGMIAEDVEQIRPDLCFYDYIDELPELRGIQYSKLVPVILKALQNLKKDFDAYKASHP